MLFSSHGENFQAGGGGSLRATSGRRRSSSSQGQRMHPAVVQSYADPTSSSTKPFSLAASGTMILLS